MQPVGPAVALDQILQPWLVDRHDAALELFDALRIDIDANDTVAQIGKACRGDQADIPGSNHTDSFHSFPPLVSMALSEAR